MLTNRETAMLAGLLVGAAVFEDTRPSRRLTPTARTMATAKAKARRKRARRSRRINRRKRRR